MGSILTYTVLICMLFGLKAKKESNRIGLIVWSAILIIGIVGSFASFSRINAMNAGWSKQNETEYLDKCIKSCPECDESTGNVKMKFDNLDCSCKLAYTKKMFPNSDDYNAALNNPKKRQKYKEYILENCNVCSDKVQEKITLEPELPDDF